MGLLHVVRPTMPDRMTWEHMEKKKTFSSTLCEEDKTEPCGTLALVVRASVLLLHLHFLDFLIRQSDVVIGE